MVAMPFPTETIGMSEALDYDRRFIDKCEALWGRGNLAPNRGAGVFGILTEEMVRGRRVVDFGCGAGNPALQIASLAGHVTGLDINADAIERARGYARSCGASNVEFLLLDPMEKQLPLKRGAADVVFSKDTIVHIKDKTRLFDEFHRVCRHKGMLVFSDWYERDRSDSAPGLNRFLGSTGLQFSMTSLGQTISLVERSGFRILGCREQRSWYKANAALDVRSIDGTKREAIEAIIGPDGRSAWSTTRELLIRAIDAGSFNPTIIEAEKD